MFRQLAGAEIGDNFLDQRTLLRFPIEKLPSRNLPLGTSRRHRRPHKPAQSYSYARQVEQLGVGIAFNFFPYNQMVLPNQYFVRAGAHYETLKQQLYNTN